MTEKLLNLKCENCGVDENINGWNLKEFIKYFDASYTLNAIEDYFKRNHKGVYIFVTHNGKVGSYCCHCNKHSFPLPHE